MLSKKKSKLKFSSKARTLDDLSKVISRAKVLPLYLFKVSDYKKNADFIISSIQKKFKSKFLVVRSSSLSEDGSEISNAGHFESVLNVSIKAPDKIKAAIQKVISSYKNNNSGDEVFVQPQLDNISMAGVAFTSDMDTFAPYYIINYDESGKSDSVTDGTGKNLKTFVYFKNSPVNCAHKKLSKLISALKELEIIFNFPHLDVEFAFSNETLYIFQVRRISTVAKEDLSQIDLKETLLKIHKKINKLSSPHPNLFGDNAVYGVMPDWNPAEIIGLKPKHLAASLYKEMITDSIWAYQRDNYGYRNLRSHPLMLLYLGVPYIDVRVDFNSFIPKELNEKIAKKLVDHYLAKLISFPVFHDKVEFEIVHSCFYFNLPEKLSNDLSKANFSKDEIISIEKTLLAITNKIINPETGLYKKDLLQTEILKEKYEKIISSKLSIVDKIYWLLEDCKRYGTLPFAGIARSAFIATQFLRSFVELKIISNKEYNLFIGSMHTITKDLNNDLVHYSKNKISKKEFLKKYGHLRPGTYDILSKRYDENFDSYFSKKTTNAIAPSNFKFSMKQINKLEILIKKYGLNITATQLIEFIKISIEGRENSKFVFTKSLSRILSLIEELSIKYGVKRDDLVYLDIKTIIGLYASLDYRDVKEIFESDIEKNKRSYNYTKAVKLPSLITKADDVYFYFLHSEEPNFVTIKSVCSETIGEINIETATLKNKIIFIKSADPGYDFLFTKNIGGLVTQFGGANSHMAVRCAEMGIPAIIGAGESNFNLWGKAKLLELDCLNKQVKIIS